MKFKDYEFKWSDFLDELFEDLEKVGTFLNKIGYAFVSSFKSVDMIDKQKAAGKTDGREIKTLEEMQKKSEER